MRAIILAAGEGSRLRPYTLTTHKALLPLGKTTLLEENLRKLARLGIKQVVINVSYLAEQIMQHIGDGSRYGVEVLYSIESEGRLGTAGGIHRALPLLGDQPFWVVSADVYCDYPLQPLKQLPSNKDLHLVMVPNPHFHPEGDYGLTASGELTLQAPKYTFANISLMRPEIFSAYTPSVYELGAVFKALITAGRAQGELYSGPWFNVGTEQELMALRDFCDLHLPLW